MQSTDSAAEAAEALEHSPDALIVVSPEGRVRSWLGAAQRLFGWPASEAIGRPLAELFEGPSGQDLADRAELRATSEWTCRTKDGTSIPVDGVMRTCGDRSVVIAMRSKPPHDSDERMIRAGDVRKALSDVSHAVRSPLSAVIGFAQILTRGLAGRLNDQQQQHTEDLLTAATEVASLLQNRFDAKRAEYAGAKPAPTLDAVPHWLNAVCDSLRPLADSRGVKIRVSVHPRIARVSADLASLTQVLYNLLSNAVKHSDDGGAVDVRVFPSEGARFRVEVQDHGCGISEANLALVLTLPTEQEAGASEPGLVFARRLVEELGGCLGAISELGRGSTFFAEIPDRAERCGRLPS